MKRLSIVIPIYNAEKTIERLLDSVLSQNWDKELYEVIACDDCSTDKTMEIIQTYTNKMDIIMCHTEPRDIHCPGNTRKDGLKYATGEWITFIDNDDMFEPDVFDNIWEIIQDEKLTTVLCCNFSEYDSEKDEYIRRIEKADTWLHGKFFNREFIMKYNINFKENLESHEDVYFNSAVIKEIIEHNEQDYYYSDLFVYRWIYREDSLSRIGKSQKYNYIEDHLNDYIIAASYPYMLYSDNEEFRGFCLNQVLMTLLHSYFYYQYSLYKFGSNDEIVRSNYIHITYLVQLIKDTMKVSINDMIHYIYSLPYRFERVKQGCIYGTGSFVEIQSFGDFIQSINKYIV